MQLVLSLFPGIGLLDRAFEEAGFCIVRGPDVLWGGGNLTDLQAHMGHATPQQTLHYTHLIAAEANTQVQQTRSLIDARDATALGEPALGQLARVRRTDLRANQAQNGRNRRVS